MIHFFKSTSFKRAYALLKRNGFYSTDFNDYQVGEIVGRVTRQSELFAPLLQILREVKLAPLIILKIQLLVQRLLQIDAAMQENEKLFQLIKYLKQRSQALIYQTVAIQALKTFNDSQANIHSNKEITDGSEQLSCRNGPTLLLVKIVNPLLQLQERLIFSYDMAYCPQNLPEMDLSMCWATVNLLRKFLEISSGMEEIGRYYFKEFSQAVISLMRVLDCDIHMLYRRIKNYLNRRTSQLEQLQQIGHFCDRKNVQNQGVAQFLFLIEGLEQINHQISCLYGGRYFATIFIANRICRPVLFKYQLTIEVFYQLKSHSTRKSGWRCKSEVKMQSCVVEWVQDI